MTNVWGKCVDLTSENRPSGRPNFSEKETLRETFFGKLSLIFEKFPTLRETFLQFLLPKLKNFPKTLEFSDP